MEAALKELAVSHVFVRRSTPCRLEKALAHDWHANENPALFHTVPELDNSALLELTGVGGGRIFRKTWTNRAVRAEHSNA